MPCTDKHTHVLCMLFFYDNPTDKDRYTSQAQQTTQFHGKVFTSVRD